MTAQPTKHETPCDAFRAFRAYAMIVAGALATFAGYTWWRMDRLEDRTTTRNESMVELQTDMRYVRTDVAEIKAVLRLRASTPSVE